MFMSYLWYGVGVLPLPSWAYQCLAVGRLYVPRFFFMLLTANLI